jgi:hypothetical protein
MLISGMNKGKKKLSDFLRGNQNEIGNPLKDDDGRPMQ